jgi:hypothetical protein
MNTDLAVQLDAWLPMGAAQRVCTRCDSAAHMHMVCIHDSSGQ